MTIPRALDVDRLRRSGWLATVEYHESLGSTNDRARELPSETVLPALVVAGTQTAGRGRGENRWWTGRGALAFSLALDPQSVGLSPQLLPRLSLASAAAVVEAIGPWLPPGRLGMRWPNDVYFDQQKLSGVLVEQPSPGRTVIGIGLNVNNSLAEAPPEVREVAASLIDLTGREHDGTELLLATLAALEGHLRELAHDPIGYGRRFHDLCLQIGQELTVDAGRDRIRGVCEGVSADGALRLLTPSGRRQIYGGVVLRPPAASGPLPPGGVEY